MSAAPFGQAKQVISSIYEVNPAALEDIAQWLEQRGIRIPISQVVGFPRAFGLIPGQGSALTAAAAVTVDHWLHTISGATMITTLNGGTEGANVTLICTSAVTFGSAGNIWAATGGGTRTVPIHAAITLAFNSLDLFWYVAGVGS